MDDRELMDKIRKSMEDTPVPESLKPENIQKMLKEQSENQQPNEAARTEKDDQSKALPHTNSGMPELPDISVQQQRQSL